MFGQLLESGVRARRRPVWTVTSAAAHAALITIATALTLRPPEGAVERVRPEEVVYVAPRASVAAVGRPQESRSAAPTWRIPRELPITVPTVPVMNLPSHAPVLSGLIDSIGPGLVDRGERLLPPGNGIYTQALVERAVVPRRDNPSPAYPATLSSAMIEGGVLVQFVVDTAGRVEPESIMILRATHRLFGGSVQRWLLRTRYSPAEFRGQAVRQLVQQEVGFTLRP